MKQSLLKGMKKNAFITIAFIALLVSTGNKDPDIKNQTSTRCCTGYNVAMNKLKKFMLDSLRTNRFEGGVFSKSGLLAAINAIPGDSVYIMNVAKNCSTSQPTDLAITSPQATGVIFAAKPNCYPCPGKACCPPKACVASINRNCISYQVYGGLTNSDAQGITAAK